MHIHILGICGTFMGGVAQLARAAGHHVTGCDSAVYPPMNRQLEAAEIEVVEGYDAAQTAFEPDCYLVGNAIARGNPLLEEILEHGLPYLSGPQWLAERVLQGRWVLAVAGTHGKTTTAAMLAWILEHAGLSPGFLIGGVPMNFGVSARLAGNDPPKHADDETTLDQLQARIASVIAYLESFTEEDFAQSDDRDITFPFAPGMSIKGRDFAIEYALPNFLFHVTTAYAILRHNGVAVGKLDYLGQLSFTPIAVTV